MPIYQYKIVLTNCPNLTNNNPNLHQIRINNPSRIIFGQININLVRNKFEQLTYIVNNEIDILMVSETKLMACLYASEKISLAK